MLVILAIGRWFNWGLEMLIQTAPLLIRPQYGVLLQKIPAGALLRLSCQMDHLGSGLLLLSQSVNNFHHNVVCPILPPAFAPPAHSDHQNTALSSPQ